MSNNLKIRQPAVAGMFYPEKKISLDQEVAKVLEEARDVELDGDVIGLIVPHAGYMFSGGVAARAYRQIFDSEVEVVVVISILVVVVSETVVVDSAKLVVVVDSSVIVVVESKSIVVVVVSSIVVVAVTWPAIVVGGEVVVV